MSATARWSPEPPPHVAAEALRQAGPAAATRCEVASQPRRAPSAARPARVLTAHGPHEPSCRAHRRRRRPAAARRTRRASRSCAHSPPPPPPRPGHPDNDGALAAVASSRMSDRKRGCTARLQRAGANAVRPAPPRPAASGDASHPAPAAAVIVCVIEGRAARFAVTYTPSPLPPPPATDANIPSTLPSSATHRIQPSRSRRRRRRRCVHFRLRAT